jgi:putative DNA primase/helicase
MPKKSRAANKPSAVRILGEGLDEWGNRYFKFSVVGSSRKIEPFSVEQITRDPKPLFAALGNAGWNGFTAKVRNQFLQQLQNRKPQTASFRVVTRLGWNSGAFVFPDEIVGQPKTPLEAAFGGLDPAMLKKYRTRGTLSDWREQVAALCVGNSRLMFAVSLAFTGPILALVKGQKSGGFQIWGDPETGKTTTAIVGGSVWGCHRAVGRREKGFVESWNSTAAKVEVTALAHNDTVLFLDETKHAGNDDAQRAKVVIEVTFKLAEQTERERLNQASARSSQCYFLSTSNLSLRQMAQQGKVVIDDAALGRLADIPLPGNGHGIYEDLHGLADGGRLSDALQRGTLKYFGTPGRVFVRKLVRERRANRAELKKFLRDERRAYLKVLKAKAQAEGWRLLSRDSGRYATTFAAGSLVIKYGILPWGRKDLLRAILSCQMDQLRRADQNDRDGKSSVESLRSKLVQYLNGHRHQFMNLKVQKPSRRSFKAGSAPGYRAKFKGDFWYYLAAKQLTAIIGGGANARILKKRLSSEGLLAQGKKRFLVQRPIFAGGKGNQNFAWIHAIKTDICKPAK